MTAWRIARNRNSEVSSNDFFGDGPHFMSRPHRTVLCPSNHVMVNRSRVLFGKKPLMRSKLMDALAKTHAEEMASHQLVFHSEETIENLKCRLQTEGEVGENVHRGSSIQQIQDLIEWDKSCISSLQNTLSNKYTEFGMGTAKGADGQIYMCQLFRSI